LRVARTPSELGSRATSERGLCRTFALAATLAARMMPGPRGTHCANCSHRLSQRTSEQVGEQTMSLKQSREASQCCRKRSTAVACCSGKPNGQGASFNCIACIDFGAPIAANYHFGLARPNQSKFANLRRAD